MDNLHDKGRNFIHPDDLREDQIAPQPKAPNPRKRKPSNTGLYTVLLLIVFAFIAYKVYTGGFSLNSIGSLTADHIEAMNFNGKVNSFTYDGSKQNTKVALLSSGYNFSIYPQWVYDIDLGDSLVKEKGSTLVTVYKPKKEKVVLDYGPILRRLERKKW
jgi:hypothetical protein